MLALNDGALNRSRMLNASDKEILMKYALSAARATRWCRTFLAALAVAAVVAVAPVFAQDAWKPTRPVTFIVPNAAAGTSDRTAREIQRIVQARRFVEVPILIVNRSGGSGTIALNQLRASPGDGHVLLILTGAMLSAQIAGLTPYGHADFTPLALMMEEYFGVHVRASSPVRSAIEMLERLKKSPDALTFGTASLSGNNFTSLATALKKGGVDIKRLKAVSFAGGNEITMALLGGHIDVISTGLGNMAEHLQQGKMRTLVITGSQRMWGPFSDVPTWKEIGINTAASSWRGMMGAKDLTSAQITYWESVFSRVVQTEEWKQELKENYWVNMYANAAATRRTLDSEYIEIKQILSDLGMAKVK